MVAPGTRAEGEIFVSSDKSISHRALIFGALATGETHIEKALFSEDCWATINVLRSLGVAMTITDSSIRIEGKGLRGFSKPSHPLECGNSGTTMRLCTGFLAGQSFESILVGDRSLSQRPMRRITNPLRTMGAQVTGKQSAGEEVAPLVITQAKQLRGLQYVSPVLSSQVKTCLLLAGLYAEEETCFYEASLTRNHTENLLQQFGADLKVSREGIVLKPGQPLRGTQVRVPGDLSSAAFFMVAASILPGSRVVLKQVGVNPSRIGIVTVLRRMGANITFQRETLWQREPVADIVVEGAPLQSVELLPEEAVAAIDEFPILFVAAATAKGESIFRGLQELRFKESDRIAMMAKALQRLGVTLTVFPDGIAIQGRSFLEGNSVASGGDHRVAMALAVAGLRANAPVLVEDCDNVATSFPSFCQVARTLGLSIHEHSP